MSEYIKQAEKFASENGIKLTILDSTYKNHFTGEDFYRCVFKCKLTRGKKSYTFDFGQSINEGSNEPNIYDILSCLTKYDVGSYENFCDDFGYNQFDEYSGRKDKQTVKTYKAVCKEYEAVERLFGDIIEQLQEIQ
jgi:hypothetical protein